MIVQTLYNCLETRPFSERPTMCIERTRFVGDGGTRETLYKGDFATVPACFIKSHVQGVSFSAEQNTIYIRLDSLFVQTRNGD